tara:strand:- start:1302 stop:1685 length:384 start_codon:yes stop_codon:yes gene_type:complete
MTWLAIKAGLKKTWAWCAKNWKLFFGFFMAILLSVLLRKNPLDELAKLWKSEDDLYNERKRLADQKHQEELDRIRRYAEVEEEIRRRTAEEKKKLDSDQKQFIDDNKDKPISEIAKLLAERTGWDIN